MSTDQRDERDSAALDLEGYVRGVLQSITTVIPAEHRAELQRRLARVQEAHGYRQLVLADEVARCEAEVDEARARYDALVAELAQDRTAIEQRIDLLLSEG